MYAASNSKELNIIWFQVQKVPPMMSPLIIHLHSQDLNPMPDLSTGQYGKSEFWYKGQRNCGEGKPFS